MIGGLPTNEAYSVEARAGDISAGCIVASNALRYHYCCTCRMDNSKPLVYEAGRAPDDEVGDFLVCSLSEVEDVLAWNSTFCLGGLAALVN